MFLGSTEKEEFAYYMNLLLSLMTEDLWQVMMMWIVYSFDILYE